MLPGISKDTEDIYRVTIRIKKSVVSSKQKLSIVVTGDFYDKQSDSRNYYSVLEDMMIYNPTLTYNKKSSHNVKIFNKKYPDNDEESSSSNSCPNTDNNNNNNYQPEVVYKEKKSPSGGMVFFYFVLAFTILMILCCGTCFYYGKYDTIN